MKFKCNWAHSTPPIRVVTVHQCSLPSPPKLDHSLCLSFQQAYVCVDYNNKPRLVVFENISESMFVFLFLFCHSSVSLSGNIRSCPCPSTRNLSCSSFFYLLLLLLFSSFREWLCVLVIASAVHVCQFSKARAPVVEVIVVLVAPAAGGVEGA